jgi:hypothetical protein
MLNSVLEVESIFRHYLETSHESHLKSSSSGDCQKMYYLNLPFHGIISAVEVIHDEQILEKLVAYIDAMVDSAEDLNGDSLPEWGPLLSGAPSQLNNFQGCSVVARAAAVISKFSSYSSHAEKWIDYVDKSIFQYWHIKRYGEKIPWIPADLGGWGSYPIWSDKVSHLCSIATSLYQATGNKFYQDIALRIGHAFKRKLVKNKTGWIWDNGIVTYNKIIPIHDSSHTNREPFMMVQMYEAGMVFSKNDVKRMGRTLTDIIWNGSVVSPIFSNYINGSNEQYGNYTKPGQNGTIYFGWNLTGLVEPRVQDVMLATIRAIQRGERNASLDRMNNSTGMLALTGHFLRNHWKERIHI